MLYNSIFSTVSYESDHYMIIHTWKQATINMTKIDFEEEMLGLLDIFEEVKPRKVIINQLAFKYVVMPDTQKWIDWKINKVLLDNNCGKIAFVMPLEFVSEISVKQVFKNIYSSTLNTRFFRTFEEAYEWINI